MNTTQPIGVFDSGYGGLTILRSVVEELPQYDYLYLSDNARAPYGSRSFDTVYKYTLECVQHLFDRGCHLIVIGCNTASARALRNIQQKDLPRLHPSRRVLGVIRPTVEAVGALSKTRHVGVLGTVGTVASGSYPLEIARCAPDIRVFQEACPMWVPLVENNEYQSPGADYFIKQHIDRLMARSPDIDTILLGCTHYPLLINKIKQFLPPGITLLSQGEIVAHGLQDYLSRHPEIDEKCSRNGHYSFFTTDSSEDFDAHAASFFGKAVKSGHLSL